jgi:hypothetical protein
MPKNSSYSKVSDEDMLRKRQQIRDAERGIRDQRVLLQRMIVQGFPTQSADDRLTQLCISLRQLQSPKLK